MPSAAQFDRARKRHHAALRWLELCVPVGTKDTEAVAEVLGHYGYGGAVIEETPLDESSRKSLVVKAYLPIDQDLDWKRSCINQGLSSLLSVGCSTLPEARELSEEDWANSWKEHFDILHLGRHLVIKPTWREYGHQPYEIVVEIDPGMAFGTGQHATSRGCLLQLERWLRPGMRIIDLGTGSGILAIAAAKLGAASVLALDIDSIAVKTAKANVQNNHVSKEVKVRKGNLTNRFLRSGSSYFDLIVANLTADPIMQLSGRITASLVPRGIFVLGGISVQRLDSVKERLIDNGGEIVLAEVDGDWVTLVGQTKLLHA